MKRLLAYSTIAHAGYMLMAISALIVLQTATKPGVDRGSIQQGDRRVVVLSQRVPLHESGGVRDRGLDPQSDLQRRDRRLQGLGFQAPALAVCMGICMFSLVGLPPLGGFFAKLVIFASVYEAGKVSPFMFVLLVIGLANTGSACLLRAGDQDDAARRAAGGGVAAGAAVQFRPGFYVALVAFPVVFLGLNIDWLSRAARTVAMTFFPLGPS